MVLDEATRRTGPRLLNKSCLGDDLPDLPVIRRVGLGMAVASADGLFANMLTALPHDERRRWCRA